MENQLIIDAKNGNESALENLMEMYKPLVVKIARKYFLINSSFDDLIQEGMWGLFKAYRSFDIDSEISFKNYATLIINRQIQTAIKTNNRNKNAPLNTYFSINNQGKILFSTASDDSDNEEENGFFLPSNSLTPEESVLFREKIKEINAFVEKILSSFEKRVLHLFISGLNYVEIAKKLKKEPKSIDNALSRIKIKLRNLKCI